jgi:hypothetical protein
MKAREANEGSNSQDLKALEAQLKGRAIDQNKLQQMDREVSNYLDEICNDQDIRDIHIEEYHEKNEFQHDEFDVTRRIMDLESLNGFLSEENQ